jgi:flagellar hook assembly protein FlgD
LPHSYALSQNYPNPFNPSTTISYDIPIVSGTVPVKILVYDIRGRLVRKLVDQEKEPGRNQVHWDGRDEVDKQVSSGVYLYRIEAGNFTSVRKMILVR